MSDKMKIELEDNDKQTGEREFFKSGSFFD
jgi:hypothetical protein